ncbi:hypothetical protein CYY_003819 [Polysphondylium violaceum]|uniref:Ankyrin repeat-containing protein n=1 Tax=Polysphondylium violaceum TaxID=133409 RepID=A0A8J4V8B6_9MYCE|nr:hypothetical protein CYY_003819 [Polysphondylium violaceum]
MNSLYREVFGNKFIKTTIYSFFSQLRAGKFSQKYDDIVKIEWIINNNHWGLLKDKVDRECFLLIDVDTKNAIFKIKDHRIFLKVFALFRDYFVVAYPPVLQVAAKENNLEALKHLAGLGYSGKQQECFTNAWDHKNSDMVIYLLELFNDRDVVKTLTSNLELAIKNSDEKVIRYLSSLPRFKEFYSQSLDEIFKSGHVEMFKLARELLPEDRIWVTRKMLIGSVTNFELFKYLVENYRSSLQDDWFDEEVAQVAVDYLADQVILYLKENNHISSETYQDLCNEIALEAYKQDNQEIYNKFKDDNCDLGNISCVSDVKNFETNLDKVKQLREEGVYGTLDCCKKASMNAKHFPVFHFLWEGLDHDDHEQSVISDFIVSSCRTNNLPLYQYMFPLMEEGTAIDLTYTDWCHMVKDEQHLAFVKQLVTTLIVPRFNNDMGLALNDASKHGCTETFKFLASKVTVNPASGIFTTPYKNAVLYEHKAILEYLVDQKYPHDNQILGKSRSVETAEYLISKGHTFISSTFKDAIGADISVLQFFTTTFAHQQNLYKDHAYLLAITDTINQSRFQHFRHLVEVSRTTTSKDILLAICKTENLQFLEYYTKKFTFHPESFKQAMSYGNLNIVKHLLANYKDQITINSPDFIYIVILKHVHIMEFLREHINAKDGVLTINPNSLSIYKGIDQAYNQYLDKYIESLNVSQ